MDIVHHTLIGGSGFVLANAADQPLDGAVGAVLVLTLCPGSRLRNRDHGSSDILDPGGRLAGTFQVATDFLSHEERVLLGCEAPADKRLFS